MPFGASVLLIDRKGIWSVTDPALTIPKSLLWGTCLMRRVGR